ncbi:MAG: hypothetical protein JW827_07720 [Spirochaetes bacterium]|nr:hypothetical protein [Spirochaetota bacterium]
MDIYINNHKLDFQLENEKDLRQVLDAINDWLFKEGKVVDQIVIDENVFNKEVESLEGYNVDRVKILRLTIIDIDVLVRNSLLEIQNYINKMMEIIRKVTRYDENLVNKIIEGIEWMCHILEKCDKLYKYSQNFKDKEFNYASQTEELGGSIDIIKKFARKNKKKECHDFLKNDLFLILEKWKGFIEHLINFSVGFKKGASVNREKVASQIYKIINKVPDIIKLIEVTTVDLQSGAEKEAMKNIQVIIGTLESIVNLLQVIQSTFSIDYNHIYFENKSIEEFNKDLKTTLNEMVDALENNDSVLIADLIEYELSPRLEKYIEILKLISKEVNLNIN